MSLDLKIYPGTKGDILYAVGTILGKRINRSTGFGPGEKDKARMRALEIELEIRRTMVGEVGSARTRGEADKGRSFGADALSIREGFEHYQYRPEGVGATTLATVRKFVEAQEGDRKGLSLTPKELYTWVTVGSALGGNIGKKVAKTRAGAVKSASTIRRELNALQGFVNFVRALEGEEAIRVKKPPEAPPRKRFMTRDERDRLIAAATEDLEWFKPVVVALFYAGLRRGEVANLKWRDVIETPVGAAIQVTSRKGRTGRRVTRIVPLHPKLQVEIDGLARRKEHVFLTPKGEPLLPVQRINKAWERLALRARVIDCSPHDARRTLATHLMDKGVQQHRISDLLGHVDGEMLSVYAQMIDEGRQRAVLALD